MKTVKIVFVDNIDTVLKSQLETLNNTLSYLFEKGENWPTDLSFEMHDAQHMEISYSNKYSFHIISHTLTFEDENTDYSQKAQDLIDDFHELTFRTLFVIDLCLDSQNNNEKTGRKLATALVESNTDGIKTVACTGIPDYDRYEIENVPIYHRTINRKGKFHNTFPALSFSSSIDQLDIVPEEPFRKFLELLLKNPFNNTQYLGEILLAATII